MKCRHMLQILRTERAFQEALYFEAVFHNNHRQRLTGVPFFFSSYQECGISAARDLECHEFPALRWHHMGAALLSSITATISLYIFFPTALFSCLLERNVAIPDMTFSGLQARPALSGDYRASRPTGEGRGCILPSLLEMTRAAGTAARKAR